MNEELNEAALENVSGGWEYTNNDYSRAAHICMACGRNLSCKRTTVDLAEYIHANSEIHDWAHCPFYKEAR